MKHKKLLPSVTIEQLEEDFYEDQHNLLDEFLRPVQKSAEYVQMKYLKPICLFGVPLIEENTKEVIQSRAKIHSQKLINTIRNA